MAEAKRDGNFVPALLGVSNADGVTPVVVYADPITHRLYCDVIVSSAVVNGGTASGSALTAAPVTVGGLAKTTNPTAVADGQVVNSLHDKLGKQVVVGSVRDLKGRQVTTITASTAETTIVTAVASTFLDVYRLIITNTSGTACNVTIKDATAGTTVETLAVPAGQTVGWSGPESAAANQSTVNNNWTATCSASVTSILITAYYVRNT